METRPDAKRATVAEVRRSIGLTQVQMAEMLGMSQGGVSKLERRENLHLTALCRFIEATGGRLRISATYGDTEIALQVGDLLDGDENEERLHEQDHLRNSRP
ncbi:MAG: XRE family transcriptional regulator [Acidimicrobiales bacterium]